MFCSRTGPRSGERRMGVPRNSGARCRPVREPGRRIAGVPVCRMVPGRDPGPGAFGSGTRGAQRPCFSVGAYPLRSGYAGAAAGSSRTARSRDRLRARLGVLQQWRTSGCRGTGRLPSPSHDGRQSAISAAPGFETALPNPSFSSIRASRATPPPSALRVWPSDGPKFKPPTEPRSSVPRALHRSRRST